MAKRIDEAAEQGVPQRSWWDSVKDVAARSWDVLVDVAKIVVAVLGIVVLIVGGPLAWVVLAAALIVLADTLYEYSQGRASAGDLAWSLLDCIPGTKGLTTTAKLAGALATLGDAKKILALGRTAVKSAAAAARGAASAVRRTVTRALEIARREADRGSTGFGKTPRFDMSGISQQVSRQTQYRHVLDHAMHKHGGYFIDEADAQRVLTDAHNGVAEFLGVGKNGWPLFRHPEVRAFDRTRDFSKEDGWLDTPTDTFFIKGSRKVSIVPTIPGRTA